jgi:hypothetical protein
VRCVHPFIGIQTSAFNVAFDAPIPVWLLNGQRI